MCLYYTFQNIVDIGDVDYLVSAVFELSLSTTCLLPLSWTLSVVYTQERRYNEHLSNLIKFVS